MDVTSTTTNKAQFYGEGGKYFAILIVNLILTMLTLGLYYPWARAKNLQYLYGETEFEGSRLTFHGTGQEMFRGLVKALIVLAILYAVYFGSLMSKSGGVIALGLLIFLVGLCLVIPLAIHGGLRYRMSRTSWRGIHFGYRGNLKELFAICAKGIFFTVITLGIYSSWFQVNLRKYITDNVRLGNLKFSFEGDGTDLFIIHLKFGFLVYITLGIYTFWYLRNVNHFHINNLKLEQDGKQLSFNSTLTPGEIFTTDLGNILLLIFTLGLATPWVIIRRMRMVLNNVEVEPGFNAEAVLQTEESYSDATGDDLLSMLDIGLDF